jgi:hypothetical protein
LPISTKITILVKDHPIIIATQFGSRLYLFHAALNCKQKDLKNMLVDNLLPELKLKQSNILTMGDFNFDLRNKNFRFSEFMEHTFSSKQIVSKVTRNYES